MIKDNHILLGVTGGIAAYKSVELLRLLKKAGADVHVVMTEAARHFVGRTTFEVLSENPVITDLWKDTGSSVAHIDVASLADGAVIAPATANCIAKLAQGLADDALTTTFLAVTSPILVCPSMNTDMYQNLRVQRNLDLLEQDGLHILDPDEGVLACKTVGAGRLPEPWFILDRITAMLNPKDLKGKRLLISAGPTREAIDPVRYISNHSSGRMGYAVAAAAEKRGGEVTLVSGPVDLAPPPGVGLISVETCDQMARAMLDELPRADIIIKVAAVADYRPVHQEELKIKKTVGQTQMTLSMTENTDILKKIGELKTDQQFLVGFAAETHDLEVHARMKMEKKNLDMIVANMVGGEDSGFQSRTNKVKIFSKDGNFRDVPLMEKTKVADIVLDTILGHLG
ncbi:bifunctional phosphopantothenoylcysteine decarboxylase/phosphopantothenate--cysteine ligase CoaBC [Desulfospira joergensenii]|uniref:bifunctional phosphopantothenoylcysteine decarboxylase/phosphopantothenate--cysteine ligase CoaBC n=1 Tax=Desulfospira joergensenii TaxID=53329 RepID=UPI0003B43D12|nr:bifunctional phosphopantothenoylcysteine decarboxylase/phosphopantothenate--cysteine ligase CoaBC [Desulfospira joergensenii]